MRTAIRLRIAIRSRNANTVTILMIKTVSPRIHFATYGALERPRTFVYIIPRIIEQYTLCRLKAILEPGFHIRKLLKILKFTHHVLSFG